MPPHEFAVKCGIFGVVVNLFTLRHFALLLEYTQRCDVYCLWHSVSKLEVLGLGLVVFEFEPDRSIRIYVPLAFQLFTENSEVYNYTVPQKNVPSFTAYIALTHINQFL